MRDAACDVRAEAPWIRRLTRAAGLMTLGVAALLAGAVASAQDAAEVDPQHYKVAFENDQVRVLRITYGPHEKSVMHSHPAGVAVFLNDLHGRFTMPDGETRDMEVEAGTVQWTAADVHQPENLGDEPFEVIQIEFKTQPGAQDTAADEAAIRASAPAWAANFNAGDADALAAMYWHDAVLQPPGAPAAKGSAAIREFFVGDVAATKAAGLTINIPAAGDVHVTGDLAYEAGHYSVTDASGATVDTGKYIGVFQKRDGKWLYIRDTWNSDNPPAPATE